MQVTILVLSALVLLLAAIFSKRIKILSKEIEEYKIRKNPSYAKRRNIYKCYCPKCNNQLSQDAVSNYRWLRLKAMIICDKCNSKLRVSILSIILYLSTIVLFVALALVSRKFAIPYLTYMAVLLVCAGLLISSLMVEKYRVIKKD
jgi:hypothetical protein